MNWKEIVNKMGISIDDLDPYTVERLELADELTQRSGGMICSRQVVAMILVQCEPQVKMLMEKG